MLKVVFKVKFRLVIMAMLTICTAIGQNDFFFNHYMFNASYYNPAWVGVEREAFVSVHLRNQWVGFSTSFYDKGGAPASQLISIIIPWQGQISGTSLSISNDRVANVNNLQIRPSLAASKEFGFGRVSVGIMPLLFFQTLDFSQLMPVEPELGIPQGSGSQVRGDLIAGLYFVSFRKYFIGLSAVHILQPSFDYGVQFLTDRKDLVNAIERNYVFMGGTEISLSSDLSIKPTVLIRTDLNAYTLDLSGIAYYQDKMWGGLSFRRAESVILMIGYSFFKKNQFKFGYSFDYVTNERKAKQPTSQEIYMRYNLPEIIFGNRQPVKTPRFPIGSKSI